MAKRQWKLHEDNAQPMPEWLDFVSTARARTIRHWHAKFCWWLDTVALAAMLHRETALNARAQD
jgi:ABC-type transport system involved in cytochrome c biogenesis permease subunit